MSDAIDRPDNQKTRLRTELDLLKETIAGIPEDRVMLHQRTPSMDIICRVSYPCPGNLHGASTLYLVLFYSAWFNRWSGHIRFGELSGKTVTKTLKPKQNSVGAFFSSFMEELSSLSAPDKFEEKYKWFNDGGFILEHRDGRVWLYEVPEGGGKPFYLDRFKNGEEAKAFADKLT